MVLFALLMAGGGWLAVRLLLNEGLRNIVMKQKRFNAYQRCRPPCSKYSAAMRPLSPCATQALAWQRQLLIAIDLPQLDVTAPSACTPQNKPPRPPEKTFTLYFAWVATPMPSSRARTSDRASLRPRRLPRRSRAVRRPDADATASGCPGAQLAESAAIILGSSANRGSWRCPG